MVPEARIRLVAVDLDGTLLNSAKQVTRTSAAMLRSAGQTAGVRVVLASARPPRSVVPFYRLLELDTPMINYNGALVCDPTSHRIILHRPIPLKIARAIVSLARRAYPQVLVSAEVMDRWYTDRLDEQFQTETARLVGPDLVAPVGQWLTVPVTKLLLLGEPGRLMDIGATIGRRFQNQVCVVQTDSTLLQIMHATVSKASALRTVAAELGVDRRQVMAIGDNANDVGMLQWAAIGVAMANAAPEALAAADYVTDHHDADGAARAVHDLIVRGMPLDRRRAGASTAI